MKKHSTAAAILGASASLNGVRARDRQYGQQNAQATGQADAEHSGTFVH